MRDLIVHIAHERDWRRAKASGTYVPAGFSEDGFIHMSRPEQAHFPANAMFSLQSGLVLLWIDVSRLAAELRFESTDATSVQEFPHLYGPLNLDAVIRIAPLEPWEPGSFALPPRPA